MRGPAVLLQALLDLCAPLRCVVCGCPDPTRRVAAGPRVGGLRVWDEPPLCRDCDRNWPSPRVARADGLPVSAAAPTGPVVAGIVHAWKYHGQRALAWPLARAAAASPATGVLSPGASLVPVPLHRRRRRERGFDQAALLARLLARATGRGCAADLVRRVRPTPQQAMLAENGDRRRNVAGAFRARPPRDATEAAPLLLVDDVVTSGATVGAVAAALRGAGWTVDGVVAVATSLPPAGPVDTPRGGS